ncbi:putative transcriptional regulatory protein GntR family [Nitratireductor aquibiodomus RA22]|uniref:Putative transcriptional regulatory protein GntR family n=1 Tax=Nitratireductor aquibiodomus RA22 TaxID=1189611 RepID=I5BSX2_9HYPH|nr:GntR family transcriptional regulator [Nitratireductor aquibiodomus]EIM72674.1 putative transcriptional regulatory protein GntR family [Nitratireductor aquibiodomus RA22]
MRGMKKINHDDQRDLEDAAPSLAEYVYKELSQWIREGRYNPGDRIREATVSKELGVSRTPVREALRRLQSERRVTIEPQRGAVVAELDRHEVVELYQLRQHLEGIAARFAAQHASEAEIAEMQDILSRSEQASGDLKLLNQINWEFHNAIYSAAHNRFLLRSIAAISDEMALLKGTKYIPDDRPASLHQEHRHILDAIAARQPDAADEAAQNHIRNSLRVHLRVARAV